MGSCMDHRLMMPRRMGEFTPLSYGSDLALWLDPSYGVYTDRSTQLAAASSQYWSVASNSTLQWGAVDTWIAGWVYSASASDQIIAEKWSGNTEFAITQHAGPIIEAYHGGAPQPSVAYSISLNTWNFVFLWQDVAGGTWNMIVNNGTPQSTAILSPITAGAGPLYLGGRGATLNVDGRMDSWAFGKGVTLGNATTGLARTIHDYFFNSGAGRVYADLSTAQKTAWGLVFAYDFDGDGLDSHGSNNLTGTNSPTYTTGIASGLAGDGDLVSLIVPRAGPNLVPPSYAGRPTWYANGGKPYISFDGVNDGLQTASNISLGAFTIAGNMYVASGGSNGIMYEQSVDTGTNPGTYLWSGNGIVYTKRGAILHGKNLSANWAHDATWRTITDAYDGTQAGHVVRFNGTAQSLTDAISANPGTSAAVDKLYVGSGSGINPTTMRLGDLVAVNANLSAAQLAQLEPWLIARRSA